MDNMEKKGMTLFQIVKVGYAIGALDRFVGSLDVLPGRTKREWQVLIDNLNIEISRLLDGIKEGWQ